MSSFSDEFRLIAIITVFSALVIFVQLLLCFKFKNKFIKLIPSAVITAFATVFYILGERTEGWDSLAYGILVIFCLILLLVCVVSWIIGEIIKKARKQNQQK